MGGHFLCFCRCPNYDDFFDEFIFQNAPKLILATLGSFGPSGGSHGRLLFSVGFGGLFHCFGRCPNQDDFLEEFVFQSAAKLVLVTLAPFGPPGGRFAFSLRIYIELCVLALQIRVFTADL